MHFMNPVPIMKLVEIINGADTSEATNTRGGSSRNDGQDRPFLQRRPRLCVEPHSVPDDQRSHSHASGRRGEPEAIDGIMKLGMNHPIGPLALSDLIGNDTVLHIMNVLYEGFGTEKYAPAPAGSDG